MRFQYISWYILLLSMLFPFLPAKIWDGTIPSKPISQQTFAIASAEAEAVSNIPLSSEWLQDTTELMYKPENNQVVFTVLTIWLIGALVLLIVY